MLVLLSFFMDKSDNVFVFCVFKYVGDFHGNDPKQIIQILLLLLYVNSDVSTPYSLIWRD